MVSPSLRRGEGGPLASPLLPAARAPRALALALRANSCLCSTSSAASWSTCVRERGTHLSATRAIHSPR
jgi:hypothetical protein